MSLKELDKDSMPIGTHQGLAWLLSQDRSFRESFAKDLLSSRDEDIVETREELEVCVGRENLYSFENRLSHMVEGKNLFTSNLVAIVPSSITLSIRSVGKYPGSPADYSLRWEAGAGKFQHSSLTLEFTGEDNIQYLVKEMISYTKNWFEVFFVDRWNSRVKVGESLDEYTSEMETYSEIYPDLFRTSDGLVIELNTLCFIAECRDGVWYRSNRNCKTYKRFELARNLGK